MKATAECQVIDQASESERAGAPSQVLRVSTAPSAMPGSQGLSAAQVVAWDGQSGVATLRFGSVELPATLHASVEPVVVRRALERGELVIAQQQAEGWLIIGVLRTCATPGLDVGDDYVIAARRVTVQAEHEILLTSGTARFAMVALGRIETFAKQITSRASAVHKIIGRAIHLN